VNSIFINLRFTAFKIIYEVEQSHYDNDEDDNDVDDDAVPIYCTDRQKDSSTMPDNSESVTPRPSQVVEHIETVIQQLSQDVSQLRQQVA